MSVSENLKRLRKEAGLSQAQLAEKSGVSQQLISQIENGRNQSTKQLPELAEALGCSVHDIDDRYTEAPQPSDFQGAVNFVPLISWVSAGSLADYDGVPVEMLDEYPTVAVAGLPPGRWIALRVEGFSMSKISPPDSVILANLDDTALIPGRCYIVADEMSGALTYKAYRPEQDPPFQPLSYRGDAPPAFNGAVKVIARVYRSFIDL